ncbi:MAG: hypothetical protein ABW172_14230, partial [Candidatus Binatia bacterium]
FQSDPLRVSSSFAVSLPNNLEKICHTFSISFDAFRSSFVRPTVDKQWRVVGVIEVQRVRDMRTR